MRTVLNHYTLLWQLCEWNYGWWIYRDTCAGNLLRLHGVDVSHWRRGSIEITTAFSKWQRRSVMPDLRLRSIRRGWTWCTDCSDQTVCLTYKSKATSVSYPCRGKATANYKYPTAGRTCLFWRGYYLARSVQRFPSLCKHSSKEHTTCTSPWTC